MADLCDFDLFSVEILNISGILRRFKESWTKLSREERRKEGKENSFKPFTIFIANVVRLIRQQQRQVSKVLLDGLYDPDSPISKLLGVRTEIVGEIIWKKLVENWQIFPENTFLCPLTPPLNFARSVAGK